MKIHHVTMQGFGPYRDTETVDFDAFADEGIFLITGRTGAGKTSILDAVTYALFGRIPRYEGTAGEKVRSGHLGPTDICEVTLEFSVPAGRHRIRRSPAFMRPKQRGDGLTPVKATVEFSVLRPDGWEVLETKTGNAERFVSDVLPLSADQFQQVILLAQGQFQEFLVADSETRRKLLSRLFDTGRFSAYSSDLDERARALGRNVATLSTKLESHATALADQSGSQVPEGVDPASGAGLAEWADEVVAAHMAHLAGAEAAQAASAAVLTAAEQAHAEATETVKRQRRRTDAVLRQETLDEQAIAVKELRIRVEEAQRAAVVAPSWGTLESRQVERGRAEAELRSASASPHLVLGEGPYEECAVATVVEELAADLQRLAEATELEATLPRLRQRIDEAQKALDDFDRTVAGQRERRAAALAEGAEAQERCEALEGAWLAFDGLDHQVETVDQALAAAREHAAAERDLDGALREQQAAGVARTTASLALDALLARQYAEYAGVLAQGLTDGDACQVCGSEEHPAKAALADDHVDEAAVERARDAVNRAHKVVQSCDGEVTRLKTRLESLTERSLGRTVEAWQGERDVLALRVAERRGVQTALSKVKARIKTLTAEGERLQAELDGAQYQRDELTGVMAAAAADLASVSTQVDERRGTHASLAALNEELTARLAATRALLAAVRQDDLCDRLLAEARAELDHLVAAQGFADEAAARAAHLPQPQLDEWERQVVSYDREVDAVARVLADPSLEELPLELVDTEPFALALAEAREHHRIHVQAAGAAAQQCTTVAATAARISDDLDGSAEARREYGLVNALASTLRGQGQNERKMALEAFALAAELEEIVASANLRLSRMTQGRFELEHSDTEDSKRITAGLGLSVLDAHTGESRSPRSLSGGEKFQASLALALGLAEVVTGRAGGLRLDTLFIDEGFGTLDPETLESTMATLDGLREGGRTIGLISHVGALKERIGAQLNVDVTPGGWSTITQR